jgi:hypothetical protein
MALLSFEFLPPTVCPLDNTDRGILDQALTLPSDNPDTGQQIFELARTSDALGRFLDDGDRKVRDPITRQSCTDLRPFILNTEHPHVDNLAGSFELLFSHWGSRTYAGILGFNENCLPNKLQRYSPGKYSRNPAELANFLYRISMMLGSTWLDTAIVDQNYSKKLLGIGLIVDHVTVSQIPDYSIAECNPLTFLHAGTTRTSSAPTERMFGTRVN